MRGRTVHDKLMMWLLKYPEIATVLYVLVVAAACAFAVWL